MEGDFDYGLNVTASCSCHDALYVVPQSWFLFRFNVVSGPIATVFALISSNATARLARCGIKRLDLW